MTPPPVRVRRLAVLLATVICLFGATLPAVAGDKEKKPPAPGAQSPPPPPAPAPEAQQQEQAAAAPAPAAQPKDRPKNQASRPAGSDDESQGDDEAGDDKSKKPDGGSSSSDGPAAQVATPQPAPQPAAPAPAPAPAPAKGQTGAPAPTSGDRGPRRERSSRGGSSEERSRSGGTLSERSAAPPVIRTTTGGDAAVAPLGPVGVAALGEDRGSGRSGSRPAGVATGFRADDGGTLPIPPVTRTVREIVEVVPGPLKAALAALALVALLFAAHSMVVTARNRRLARQREQLLDEVGLLQAALLPAVPARLGDLVSTVAYRPAEGPAAGGDFYDAFVFDAGRVGVIVGDVSGHGREALARTALMRYTLRAYLDAGLGPRAALKVAGSVLDDDLGTDFATVVVAVYDPEAGTLTYASAGHPPPILLGPPAHEPVTGYSSPPIGAGATTGLRETTLSLPQGSVACFFTDGMTDARVGNDLLGRERLAELLAGLGPGATAPQLLERVAEFADRTPDDMAACILHADGQGSGRIRIEELEVSRSDLAGQGVVRFLRDCGISMAEIPALLRSATDTAREAGSAVLRVRMGDWRPGVDVLPGNVETLVAARRSAAARAHTS